MPDSASAGCLQHIWSFLALGNTYVQNGEQWGVQGAKGSHLHTGDHFKFTFIGDSVGLAVPNVLKFMTVSPAATQAFRIPSGILHHFK